jgi:NAD(P)-dependent dehydrogenase (short-subunit alcohol dehydrogenase family)
MTAWNVAGKRILVTGATSGIGLEAAAALAAQGADVVLVGRSPERTQGAVAEVERRSGRTGVESLLCDFASQRSVRALASRVLGRYDRLDVLIDNAGGVNASRRLTEDGIEATFAVNHLGYFLLTNLLLDLLVKSAPARIVVTASRGHRFGTIDFDDLGFERGYQIMKAYGRSKLANVLFTRELARRLSSTGVTVNCLHPGAVATNIWSGAPGWAKPILAVAARPFFISAEKGGQTLVHLAASPDLDDVSGEYFEKNVAVKPGKLAHDDELARRLWDVSAEMTGLASSAAQASAATQSASAAQDA